MTVVLIVSAWRNFNYTSGTNIFIWEKYNDTSILPNVTFLQIFLFFYYYYCLVRAFRLWTSFWFYISFSFTYFASYISTSSLIHSIILHSLNSSVSRTMTTFAILPPCCASLLSFLPVLYCLSSIIAFSSVSPSPVSFNVFLCPLVLLLFRILLLHVSGLLLSFYIVCILLLPLLSSIPLLLSRFLIWILLIFFCPSTSSFLLSILVTLLWRFFCNYFLLLAIE